MLNVHLNGDMVRCPDHQTIQEKLKEKRRKEGKCCYGVCMMQCMTWRNYNKEKILSSSRKWSNSEFANLMHKPCTLKRDIICPMSRLRRETGSMEKTFKIDNRVYRQISSAGHYMVKNSKYKTIFFTLTFPNFKRQTDGNELNERFSMFLENLRKTYSAQYYIAVREYGEKTCRIHYHCLVSMPFVSFSTLNDAWYHTIQDICDYSNHALSTKRNEVILRDPGKAFRYVCKYISKAKGTISHQGRLVFMSAELARVKPIKHQGIEAVDLLHLVNQYYKSIYVNQTDWTTIFRITDPAEFDDFCAYLYHIFEISEGKTDFTGITRPVSSG